MSDVSASERGRFAPAGAVAGVLVAAFLLAGAAGLVTGLSVTRNWLATLFAINAGLAGFSMAGLHYVALLDVALLVLTALTFAGFWPGPGRPRRVWMGLAIGLPLAGVVVLLATGLAGRSGLMGGGIVLSVLMILDTASRPLGYLGVAANSMLLVGDFATGGSRSIVIATVVGVGYVLLIVWFALIAWRLAIGHPSPPAPPHT